PSGWWVLVLGGPQFGSHVQVVRVLATGDTGWTLQLESSPSRDWMGLPSQDLLGAPAVGRFDSPIATWLIHLPSGLVATAEYRISGDSAIGTVTYDSNGVVSQPSPLWGVRADSAVLVGGEALRGPGVAVEGSFDDRYRV